MDLGKKEKEEMKVRIGIDVGGTFTDAALIDNDTFELIDTVKVPTTHASEAGVAEGIVQVLAKIMEKNHIDPDDVIFIAHGTTQATNALLEGDVVKVGIVTIGSGIEGIKSKSDPADIVDPVLRCINPLEGDPDYAYVECAGGKKFALSLSGAANIAGYVDGSDYASGNAEAAKKAWKPLADQMGISVEEAAERALALSAQKNSAVVKSLMEDYNMNPRTTILVGGGGGAASVVPHLAGTMDLKYKNAKNAPVISTIGVALAMVRDMVERTIPNPTDQDILAVRREAEEKAIASGANPESIEVSVEVDASKNLVRATAIGTTELRSKDLTNRKLEVDSIKKIVGDNIGVGAEDIVVAAANGSMYAMQYIKETKKFFGLVKSCTRQTRIVDEEGIIRLQKQDGHVRLTDGAEWKETLPAMIERYTEYNDGGKTLPNIYAIYGKRIIDLSGLENLSRVMALAGIELANALPEDKIILLCSARAD